MSESSCLQLFFTFLFCFVVLFLGFPLCVNCALCPRIYLHDSRNLSGAKNISQVRAAAAEIDCSPEPQVAKWAARQSSSSRSSSIRSRVVHQSDCGSVTHLPPSLSFPFHSHSSFPSASFSAFSPAPTQPQSLWQTVLNPCTALPTHCVRACAWNASGMRVWNASSAQKATSCSANCLTTQVKSAPWACKCAVGAFVST